MCVHVIRSREEIFCVYQCCCLDTDGCGWSLSQIDKNFKIEPVLSIEEPAL